MVLKIGYFAHGPWAHRALDQLVSDKKFEIVFVATRQCGDPVLQEMADHHRIPFILPQNVNDPATLSGLGSFGADLFVSMSFNQIFKRTIIEFPRLGTINCHAGALPFYRGRNVLNWAIINGESQFGVTVHKMDEGIDTGPILRQDFVPIGPNDTYGDILTKAHEQCAVTLHAALKDLVNGRVPRQQSEIHPVGFYCGERRSGDEWLDWRLPSQYVHNFVRGISNPGPCARTRMGGKEWAIVRTSLIEGAVPYSGITGQVVGKSRDEIQVKTGDSMIAIREVSEVSASGDLGPVIVPKFRIGSRFVPWIEQHFYDLEQRLLNLENALKNTR